ncbi:MAG: MBL fold metallo-hydrolase [Sphaerochaetaceae bacterium]
MIRYAVLGSGSSGNSYAITDGHSTLLIDQGFSLVELKRRLSFVSIPFETVLGVCVTHLHPDHTLGLGTFARRSGLPVYLNENAIRKEPEVFDKLNLPPVCVRTVQEDSCFSLDPFGLCCFPTSHDCGGSVGWLISIEGRKLMVLTDTGVSSDDELVRASQSDILFLEANYDEELLAKGPYPVVLKRRIAGNWGHLSNTQALQFLQKSAFHGQEVYFVHLSAVNNNPILLSSEVRQHYQGPFTVCERGKCYQGMLQ